MFVIIWCLCCWWVCACVRVRHIAVFVLTRLKGMKWKWHYRISHTHTVGDKETYNFFFFRTLILFRIFPFTFIFNWITFFIIIHVVIRSGSVIFNVTEQFRSNWNWNRKSTTKLRFWHSLIAPFSTPFWNLVCMDMFLGWILSKFDAHLHEMNVIGIQYNNIGAAI